MSFCVSIHFRELFFRTSLCDFCLHFFFLIFVFQDVKENQIQFLENLSVKLGYKDTDFSKWYSVTFDKICENGGSGLLNKYGGSPFLMFSKNYPNYDWLPWRFSRTSKSVYKDLNNIKKAINFVENKLGIKERSDWRRVSIDQLRELEVAKLFIYHGGISKTLKLVYPESDLTL